jgi:hypothetical protein
MLKLLTYLRKTSGTLQELRQLLQKISDVSKYTKILSQAMILAGNLMALKEKIATI